MSNREPPLETETSIERLLENFRKIDRKI